MDTESPSPDDLRPSSCPGCGGTGATGRREFLRTSAGAVASTLPFVAPAVTRAATTGKPETLVSQLYGSLNESQRSAVCFPFGHERQSKIDNNWFITDTRVRDLTGDQQALVRQIVHGLHSDEYADRVVDAIEHDNGENGFGKCSVALFGEPGSGRFEFVFTGRHVTRRCDGDSVEGAAFGGPIFYGHQAGDDFDEDPDHPGNVYWYQAERANQLFQALDGKQREVALLDKARPERKEKTVELTGKQAGLEGIPVGDLSADQKELVRKVMADVLAPFRKADADEAMRLVERNGFDHLHMAYFKGHDVGDDGVWDVWQIEGPAMLWYFRGDPHVHTWVHIRETA